MAITKKSYGHSPAGREYIKSLKRKKKGGTQPVYFKTAQRTSDIERLKRAGLTKDDLRSLGYKGK